MIDLIFSFLAKAIAEGIEGIFNIIMPVFGFDFALFNNTFPFAAVAYTVFQRVALAIALMLAAWQMMPFLTGNLQKMQTTPVRAVLGAVLAVGGIYYGNYILSAIIDIAQYPFDYIQTIDGVVWGDGPQMDMWLAAVSDIFYSVSILVYIIALIMIGWSMIKLLLEAVERYLVMFVLLYLSPLAFSTLAAESTSGICKRFFSMFISQCILLLLNIWSIKMALSMMGSLDQVQAPILGLIAGYAFLRIALKMDTYLNQLGLNAAITGAGLGMELIATGSMLAGAFTGGAGSKSMSGGAGGSTSTNPILGAASKLSSVAASYNPISAASSHVGDVVKTTYDNPGMIGAAINKAKQTAAEKDALSPGGKQGAVKRAVGIAKDSIGNYHSGMKEKKMETFAGSDSGISRWASEGRKKEAINNMSDANKPLDSQNQQIFAHSPSASHRAYKAFAVNGFSSDEATDIASVMQGLGVESAHPAGAEVLDVGYGNVPAENISYRMDGDGIRAAYTRNGNDVVMQVKNQEQLDALSPAQKQAYKRMGRINATQYYYSYDSSKPSKVPTPPKNKGSKDDKPDAPQGDGKDESPADSNP